MKNQLRFGADSSDFEEHFQNDGQETTCFYNLGRDAQLLCPQQLAPHDSVASIRNTHAHLLPFLCGARKAQISALWQQVAKQYLAFLQSRRHQEVWLSTSEEGVPWLHFRLDSRPKYYQYSPFATITQHDASDDEDMYDEASDGNGEEATDSNDETVSDCKDEESDDDDKTASDCKDEESDHDDSDWQDEKKIICFIR